MPKGTYEDAHIWWISKFRPIIKYNKGPNNQITGDWNDEFVLNNIDPEKQQAYIDATSKLSGMGVAEWQTLAKSLQEDSGGKFFDTLAAIARARGPDVAEGAAGAAKGGGDRPALTPVRRGRKLTA